MHPVLSLALFVGCFHAAPAPEAAGLVRTIPMTTRSEEARALFEEAEQLRLGMAPERARETYARAAAADPGFAQGELAMGWNWGPESQAHVDRALALAADLPPLERQWIAAQVARMTHQPDALDQLAAVAAAAPGDWYAQVALGEVAHGLGELSVAHAALERAVALEPEGAVAYNSLAYVLAAEGDLERAATTITRYAELSPGDPNPQDSRGEILLMAGRLDEAEQAFRAALAIDPGFRADDGLAAVQLHRGDLDGGVTTLERAFRRTTEPHLKYELGHHLIQAYLLTDRDDAALAIADALEAVGTEMGLFLPAEQVRFLKARIRFERERWDEAIPWMDQAIAAATATGDPRGVDLATRISALRLRAALGAGDLATAERLAATIRDSDIDEGLKAWTRLAMAHHQKDPDAATEAMAELANIPHYASEARLMTADVLAATGRLEEATALRRQVAATPERSPRSVILRRRAERALSS